MILKIKELQQNLENQGIDYFLLPNSDEFFCEYLPNSEKRIEFLTNFTGSNAFLIIGRQKSYFFTDSRYILQAKNQIDLNEFEIFDMVNKRPFRWLEENLKNDQKIAIDSKLHNINFVEALKTFKNLVFLAKNPVDEIWQNEELGQKNEVFLLSEKLTGESWQSKVNRVLKDQKADAKLICDPQNICWLLNIRSSDVEFTPLVRAYAILYKNGEIDVFFDEKRLKNEDLEQFNGKISFFHREFLENRIKNLKNSIKSIEIDKNSTNFYLFSLIKDDFEVIFQKDIIDNLKAIKNKVEIDGAIKSHEADKIALAKFFAWIDKKIENHEEIDEILAQNQLLEFRKENKNFLYQSFSPISSFGSNGAIIHYSATKKTNKKFEKNSLYLIDSGGQYFGDFIGTTDVTRTIAIGDPTKEMIEDFTRVLKGHIAIARVKFPRGTTGAQLDVLARFHLWQASKDYGHGTGHGVGSFLSVHENGCGISKRANFELVEGMILSNEPGYYKEGEYGIRIENLMLVEQHSENFLKFKTLTKAPIDSKLIDFKMLTYPEKKWLQNNS